MSPTYYEQSDHYYIICPYCEERHEGSKLFESGPKKETEEFECNNCEEKFFGRCEITLNYIAIPSCHLLGKNCTIDPKSLEGEYPRCESCRMIILPPKE